MKLVLAHTTLRNLTGMELERAVGGISGERLGCNSIDLYCPPGGTGWGTDFFWASGPGIGTCTC